MSPTTRTLEARFVHTAPPDPRVDEGSRDELDVYLHRVSTDLQAPVRAIHGFSKLLAEHLANEGDPRRRHLAQRVVDNAGLLGKMIDGLGELARLTNEAPHPEWLRLDDPVSAVLHELRRDVEEAGARVAVAELPVAIADRCHVTRILRELVTNALVHAGERPAIAVDGFVERGTCYLVVEDDGPGLPSYAFERVFEPFQATCPTADGAPRRIGLGLAVARRLAEKNQGRLTSEARTDGVPGARFVLALRNPA